MNEVELYDPSYDVSNLDSPSYDVSNLDSPSYDVSNLACGCFLCNAKVETTLPENKFTTEHPLTVIQNGIPLVPEILGESLILDSQHIKSIWLNTLNYLHVKSLSVRNNPLIFLADVYSLHTLDCSNCTLKSLPSYMPSLSTLNCSNNLIASIPNFQQLTRLECSNNIISKLPSLPNLKSLTINNNPIHEINIPTLTYLEAYDCPIFVIFDIHGLVRRSSTLDKFGSFKWITTRTEKLNSKTLLVDWPNSKLHPILHKILTKTKFWRRIIRYLFKN
jgi:Leucine-rich repeat (LRR) protein